MEEKNNFNVFCLDEPESVKYKICIIVCHWHFIRGEKKVLLKTTLKKPPISVAARYGKPNIFTITTRCNCYDITASA